jgi:hypothetical protein
MASRHSALKIALYMKNLCFQLTIRKFGLKCFFNKQNMGKTRTPLKGLQLYLQI